MYFKSSLIQSPCLVFFSLTYLLKIFKIIREVDNTLIYFQIFQCVRSIKVLKVARCQFWCVSIPQTSVLRIPLVGSQAAEGRAAPMPPHLYIFDGPSTIWFDNVLFFSSIKVTLGPRAQETCNGLWHFSLFCQSWKSSSPSPLLIIPLCVKLM